jgi:lipopolysaccharide transport system permease protein
MYAYFKAIWACRFFWLSLVKMDLRTRYRGSVLGIGWSLLQPLAMTAILCTVFCRVFNQSVREYAPFLLAGLTCWNYLTNVCLTGSNCFFQGEMYIRQYPAPMAIYPLRTVLGASFHFCMALMLVLVLTSVLNGFSNLAALLYLIPTMLMLLILGWALATLFGLATVRFRDTHHLAELALQALFYLTPVMYQPDMLLKRGFVALIRFNPVVPFLNLLRLPILEGRIPPLSTFLWASLIVLVASTLATVALKSQERQLIFHL